MIKALDIANTILEQAFNEKIEVTPMKLQKLIYILYKEYLKKTDESLFLESFQAWKYGPVLVSVYDQFKKYKGNKITDYFWEFDNEGKRIYKKVDLNCSEIFNNVFYSVWINYKNYDANTLSDFTHRPDTAWDKARNKEYILLDKDIKNESSYD